MGDFVHDLVTKRSARVVRMLPAGVELSGAESWCVEGFYCELLCRIPSPSVQELALESPGAISAGLKSLEPADRVLALLRGRRLGVAHRIASRPMSDEELAREHDTFLGTGGAEAVAAARLALVDHPEVVLIKGGGFALQPSVSSVLQDQFLAVTSWKAGDDKTYGQEFCLGQLCRVSPLTTEQEAGVDRCRSEQVVHWLLNENLRLQALEGLDAVDKLRREALWARLLSTVARHCVVKLYKVEGSQKRRWREPESLIERVVQTLIERLSVELSGVPLGERSPTDLVALAALLTNPTDLTQPPYASHLLHRAVDQVVDRYFAKPRFRELEDGSLDSRDASSAREQSFSGVAGRGRTFRDPSERLGAAAAKAYEFLAEDLSRAHSFVSREWPQLTSAPHGAEPSEEDLKGALEFLVEALRTGLIARLEERPRWRRTLLLYLSTPAHSFATCNGALTARCGKCGATPEEGVHRSPSRGTLSSALSRNLPLFVRDALPEALRPYATQGRALLPLLRAAHAIFPRDVWDYAESERERVLIEDLLFGWGRDQHDKRGRGVTKEFLEELAIGAAAPAGGDWAGEPLLAEADIPLFVETIVIPFVERTLEGRRTLPEQRRASALAGAATWRDLFPVLELILYGVPDAAALVSALRGRSEAEVAQAVSLSRVSLYDLRAGREFAPLSLSRALEGALELEEGSLGGLVRPPLTPEFQALLEEDEAS
ncbi:MAG: hypothetical protein JKY65_18195 [Planctomycetes bacterium]|nr:hypothetical protein [Planctomycetota bacterium]